MAQQSAVPLEKEHLEQRKSTMPLEKHISNTHGHLKVWQILNYLLGPSSENLASNNDDKKVSDSRKRSSALVTLCISHKSPKIIDSFNCVMQDKLYLSFPAVVRTLVFLCQLRASPHGPLPHVVLSGGLSSYQPPHGVIRPTC